MGRKAPKKKVLRAITSDKHDILYSKARYVLNQRHIKRPWFNLNPFLEKTDEFIDLDNYLPEESKYIQPLESLVLRERFSSDHPVDTREIAVDHFFDYLFSDEWSDGCSVRVLDGQLLDELLVCLYRMEREKTAVRHTTYAFAKNKRPRTGCYKLADKEAYGYIQETLLIEFAYFGSLCKTDPNPVTTNPLEHLRTGVTDFSEDSSPLSFSPPLLEGLPRRKRAASINIEASHFRSNLSTLPDTGFPSAERTGRRYSLMAKPLNAIRFIQSMSPTPRRMSVSDPSTSSGSPMSVLQTFNEKREDTLPEVRRIHRPRTEFNGVDPRELLKKFPMQKVLRPADDRKSNDEKDSDDGKHNEKEESFGDEFYLSNEKVKHTKQPESITKKLQRKKAELQDKRRERIAELKARQILPDKPVLPKLPPLDFAKVADQGMLHCTIKLPDELPTFEQFIRILKDDEYYDPRYRNKVRLKSKKIAQRYYIAKGRRNSHLFEADSAATNMLAHLRLFNKERRKSNASEYGSRATVRLPALKESQRGIVRGRRHPQTRNEEPVTARIEVDPASIADEVLGVTDSEPCKEHCLTHKRSCHKANDDSFSLIASKRSSTNTARAQTVKNKGERSDSLANPPQNTSPDFLLSKSPLPPISTFPKALACDEESEYADTDSEDTDTEDDTVSTFDATKINIRYSIERLRKKQRKKKKKPAFYDILAKYYKMQNAMTAFRKGSMTNEIKGAKARAGRLSLAGYFRGKLHQ